MRAMLLVTRREFASYFNSIWGYIVAAVILVLDGLLFNAFALTDTPRYSFEVMRDFFYFSFGTTTIAALLLTMRLVAEEKQTNTIVLLGRLSAVSGSRPWHFWRCSSPRRPICPR